MKTTLVSIAIVLHMLAPLKAHPFDESLKVNLAHSPAIYKALLLSLDFKKVEWGNVPMTQIDPEDISQGFRATWSFEARPKGQGNDYPLQVSISVVTKHFDDEGHPTIPQNASQAARTIEGVTLTENEK